MKALFLESLPYESTFKVGSHHYAEGFLDAGWDVMWISHPISPAHFFAGEKRELDVRLRGWRDGPIRSGNLLYYSPMTLMPTANAPLLRSRAIFESSATATTPSLAKVIERAGFSKPDVVWLTNPVYQPLLEKLAPRCLAVRVADDQAAFKNVPEFARNAEDSAIAEADVVFAVSNRVYERLSAAHGNVVRLPNGVDFEHFATPVAEPDDLAAIPQPRVLYVGATEYWFGGEMLAQFARERRDVSVVVVGPESSGIGALRDEPNVHLLGPRPWAALPGYLQHCDVGVIPFVRDEMVDAIHPIKLYEYLAAGLPVVATEWPELASMGAPAKLVEAADFVRALSEEVDTPSGSLEERQAYARANSWSVRFEQVLTSVDAVLTGHPAPPRTSQSQEGEA